MLASGLAPLKAGYNPRVPLNHFEWDMIATLVHAPTLDKISDVNRF